MNNSLAAKFHQVERGLSTKHATKWKSLLSIWFIVVYHVYIDVWKHVEQESYNTRDKFAFKLRETMQLWVVFFVNILADFLVTRGERLT